MKLENQCFKITLHMPLGAKNASGMEFLLYSDRWLSGAVFRKFAVNYWINGPDELIDTLNRIRFQSIPGLTIQDELKSIGGRT